VLILLLGMWRSDVRHGFKRHWARKEKDIALVWNSNKGTWEDLEPGRGSAWKDGTASSRSPNRTEQVTIQVKISKPVRGFYGWRRGVVPSRVPTYDFLSGPFNLSLYALYPFCCRCWSPPSCCFSRRRGPAGAEPGRECDAARRLWAARHGLRPLRCTSQQRSAHRVRGAPTSAVNDQVTAEHCKVLEVYHP
jgi:hypothetical protein